MHGNLFLQYYRDTLYDCARITRKLLNHDCFQIRLRELFARAFLQKFDPWFL